MLCFVSFIVGVCAFLGVFYLVKSEITDIFGVFKFSIKCVERNHVPPYYIFSVKLMSSEIDDSRPTVIRKLHDKPTFVSVLSGKINTVYDLDEVLR